MELLLNRDQVERIVCEELDFLINWERNVDEDNRDQVLLDALMLVRKQFEAM